MYRYETHCHTSPVSACGKAKVEDTVRFYKQLGYDGIFITNHFLDGNICVGVRNLTFQEQIHFYFSDYEEALRLGKQLGLKVFPGVELSYKGTDFLIYGLDKEWYLSHPEIMNMKKTEELSFMMQEGALVIQAHPYREEYYIDHIRLFPRCVHGAEVVNSSQADFMNEMAVVYAKRYSLYETCGSDNHWGSKVFESLQRKGLAPVIAGMQSEIPLECAEDYKTMLLSGKMKFFSIGGNV
jgi:predicted metal-dependent phosphoesterase TrpH